MAEYLIETCNLTRTFGSRREQVTAVDNVSLGVREGEVVCLVGESGCGKTTTGKIIAGLLRPTAGQVLYQGRDVWARDKAGFKGYRLGVQLIHQDPYASLNPSHTIDQILSAPLLHHGFATSHRQARERAAELLEIVDLTPVEDFLTKYPHQLSGGQRQRVSVARALTVNPSFIVADEAVSMVDVSIRVGLLNMLSRLKESLGVTFLFIQINEYVNIGFAPQDSAQGTIFYGLTGLHGAHVFVGLTLLTFATIRAFRGHFSAHEHRGVEIPGIYWHFVDVMWIVVFLTVYII